MRPTLLPHNFSSIFFGVKLVSNAISAIVAAETQQRVNHQKPTVPLRKIIAAINRSTWLLVMTSKALNVQ